VLPVHVPTLSSARPVAFPRATRPRTSVAVCLPMTPPPMKLPSGAMRMRLSAVWPICVVNCPPTMPGHSIGTSASKPRIVRPFPATSNRVLSLPR